VADVMKVFALDFFELFNIACAHPMDYKARLYIITLTPIGLTAAAILIRAATMAAWGGTMLEGYSIKFITTFIFIALPLCATTACSAFSCDDYDDDNLSFM